MRRGASFHTSVSAFGVACAIVVLPSLGWGLKGKRTVDKHYLCLYNPYVVSCFMSSHSLTLDLRSPWFFGPYDPERGIPSTDVSSWGRSVTELGGVFGNADGDGNEGFQVLLGNSEGSTLTQGTPSEIAHHFFDVFQARGVSPDLPRPTLMWSTVNGETSITIVASEPEFPVDLYVRVRVGKRRFVIVAFFHPAGEAAKWVPEFERIFQSIRWVDLEGKRKRRKGRMGSGLPPKE